MTTVPAEPRISFADDFAAYQPGACNIGSAEIAARRRFGLVGVAIATLLGVALVAVGAPPVARLLVALPLAGGAVGLLQARSRFCAAYAMRGVQNFGPLGSATTISDAAALAADRRRARELLGRGALIGLAGGLLVALLPV